MPSVVERATESQEDLRSSEFKKMNGSIVGNGAKCPRHHGDTRSPDPDPGVLHVHSEGISCKIALPKLLLLKLSSNEKKRKEATNSHLQG